MADPRDEVVEAARGHIGAIGDYHRPLGEPPTSCEGCGDEWPCYDVDSIEPLRRALVRLGAGGAKSEERGKTMGREIRRVPLDWEHPRDRRGEYIPLYDETYETVRERWIAGFRAWYDGTHPELENHPGWREEFDYWEWVGDPPEREFHRPAWPEGAELGYQVYETVSEGTPTSPVFPTTDALVGWLVGRGYSETAARRFVELGSVPSLMTVPDQNGGVAVLSGIEIAGYPGGADPAPIGPDRAD